MYFGGSAVGKASTIGIEISPTPPLIFKGGQKMWNLALFLTSLNFEQPTFENAARYLNSETKVSPYIYVLAKIGEVGSMHAWESSVSVPTS